jgi:hypothetical protein
MGFAFRSLLGAGLAAVLLMGLPAQAADPLDDVDGTEGWDQVVQPRQEKKRDMQAERDAFKREVADWESIRQLWQEQRERYIMEKTAHQRHFKRLKTVQRQRRRPPPKADITEETLSRTEGEGDWGDEPGREWFQDSSKTVDSAIDDELGETGAVPGTRKQPARTRPAPVYIPPPSGKGGEVPDAFKQRKTVDPEAQAAEEEIRRMREVEDRKRRAATEKKRLEEEKRQRMIEEQRRLVEERKRREEEARRKKEEEAAAGAAAAEALLKQQAEEIRKEQEAIRKKAKLKTDEEGQVVDPELQKEMEEDEEEEEED